MGFSILPRRCREGSGEEESSDVFTGPHIACFKREERGVTVVGSGWHVMTLSLEQSGGYSLSNLQPRCRNMTYNNEDIDIFLRRTGGEAQCYKSSSSVSYAGLGPILACRNSFILWRGEMPYLVFFPFEHRRGNFLPFNAGPSRQLLGHAFHGTPHAVAGLIRTRISPTAGSAATVSTPPSRSRCRRSHARLRNVLFCLTIRVLDRKRSVAVTGQHFTLRLGWEVTGETAR